jgi:cupin fold WbuC family metalloprotein
MKKIFHAERLAAIFHKKSEWKEGLDFITPDETFIQVGTWWYQSGKDLKPHKHITNERTVLYTQETIVILNGSIEIHLYDDEKKIFHREKLAEGDIGIILSGGHGYRVLEDQTKVVEIKNGPFYSVEKDKEMIQP